MYSQREIACIALHEKVVHLDDFLLRRSLLVMSGELTYDLVVKVREVIGDALGWSADVCPSGSRACTRTSSRTVWHYSEPYTGVERWGLWDLPW